MDLLNIMSQAGPAQDPCPPKPSRSGPGPLVPLLNFLVYCLLYCLLYGHCGQFGLLVLKKHHSKIEKSRQMPNHSIAIAIAIAYCPLLARLAGAYWPLLGPYWLVLAPMQLH